jgi:hypothetical protein
VNALAAYASLCSHSFKLKCGAHFKNFVTLMFLIIFLNDCTSLQLCKWAHEEKQNFPDSVILDCLVLKHFKIHLLVPEMRHRQMFIISLHILCVKEAQKWNLTDNSYKADNVYM